MTTDADLRALAEAAKTHPDGLLHSDDCLFAQDVGPCTCGRADVHDMFQRAASPIRILALLDRLATAEARSKALEGALREMTDANHAGRTGDWRCQCVLHEDARADHSLIPSRRERFGRAVEHGFMSATPEPDGLDAAWKEAKALAQSWETSASRVDERAMMGDPAAAMATSQTLRSCAAALHSLAARLSKEPTE